MPAAEEPLLSPTVEYHIVRLATIIAASVAVAYLILGSFDADSRSLLGRAITPSVVALAGLGMIGRRSYRADLLLAVGVGLMIIQVEVHNATPIRSIAGMAVIAAAAAGAYVTRWRLSRYQLFSSLAAVLAHVTWYWDAAWSAETVALVLVPGFLVWFTTSLVVWSKRSIERREVRYGHLFQRAPVSIWQEDYSRVGSELASLRERGVEDVRAYLAAHPAEVARLAGLIVVVDVNPAGMALMEAADKEILLGSIRPESFAVDTAGSFVEQFAAIWDDRDSLDIEVRGLTLTGAPIDGVLRWVVPRVDGRLDLTDVVVSIVDVTRLKQAERAAQELVVSKDKFIASVSHELRTPLTAIVGLAEELRKDHDAFGEAERKEFIEIIAQQAVDVAHIVEDLLVAARADIGTLSITLKPVDLAAQVRAAMDTLHGLTPKVVVDPGTAEGVADPTRLRQILRNLLTNAFRYGGESIEVRFGERPGTVWVEVVDNGPGIPEAYRDRIFEPYVSAHQVKGLTASVGLGLTVSRELARLMGGDLEYHHDGSDSIFRLTLGAAAPSQPRSSQVNGLAPTRS